MRRGLDRMGFQFQTRAMKLFDLLSRGACRRRLLCLGFASMLAALCGACQSRGGPVGDPASIHSEPVAPIDQAVRMQRQMGQITRSQSAF
jgi:hypothetical protein